jgi:hypothetical protein
MCEATVRATGFCEVCTAATVGERYKERERVESESRIRAWRAWDRERQRHHRLMVKLRPTEPASPEVDPLELGRQALHLLGQMRLHGAYQMAVREQVGELVRQLAWGPASTRSSTERSRTAPDAGP